MCGIEPTIPVPGIPKGFRPKAQGCEARATSALAPEKRTGHRPLDPVNLGDAIYIVG